MTLRNLFFTAPEEDLPQPPHRGASIVQGKTYDSADPDWDYVEHAFGSFQGGARIDRVRNDLHGISIDAERYGAPVLTAPRLGQVSFRLAVLDAYGTRCAVTGSRTTPALEAAPIRDYAHGGEHLVTNGLAMRPDIHRLYDRGYVGVDADYRLRVSPRLGADYGNGVDLYARQERGDLVTLPARREHWPDRDALGWHMERRFLSA